jgi:dTDP-glucose 4,6-dehydratase
VTKRILVTGGFGFVGSHLVSWILKKTNWEVVVLDRIDSAGSQNRLARRDGYQAHRDRCAVVHHDLRAAISDSVARELFTGSGAFEFSRFDYIAHLAAGSHVDRSVVDPVTYVLDNVLGTANLLEFVRLHCALETTGRLQYFGTDEVFGSAPDGVAFGPLDRHRPLNPYAATKSGGEMLCPAYAQTYGTPIVITHATNIIGPDQHAEKFIPIAIRCTKEGEPVTIHTVNGQPCSRFYLDVDNVSAAVLLVLEKGSLLGTTESSGRYNIGGDVEVSNVTAVHAIAEELGVEPRYTFIENPPGRLKPDLRYCIDSSALLELGWERRVTFAESIKRTVRSYK